MIAVETKIEYETRHGSPYDRGSADSYYGRPYNPHFYRGDTYNSEKVELADMNAEQIIAYTAGYRDNEADGNKKDWG